MLKCGDHIRQRDDSTHHLCRRVAVVSYEVSEEAGKPSDRIKEQTCGGAHSAERSVGTEH